MISLRPSAAAGEAHSPGRCFVPNCPGDHGNRDGQSRRGDGSVARPSLRTRSARAGDSMPQCHWASDRVAEAPGRQRRAAAGFRVVLPGMPPGAALPLRLDSPEPQ
jgi:hypothetical protein